MQLKSIILQLTIFTLDWFYTFANTLLNLVMLYSVSLGCSPTEFWCSDPPPSPKPDLAMPPPLGHNAPDNYYGYILENYTPHP